MPFELRRIILFTSNMDAMARLYRDVLGLEPMRSDQDWREFRAGACSIALHRGNSSVGSRAPKLAFFAKDVAAARATLIKRGATGLGKTISGDSFDMCNGKDPDGTPFQLSSRG